ncbi:MAG: hypothetical protein AB1443_13150 [Pseudomonadota bacterium]
MPSKITIEPDGVIVTLFGIVRGGEIYVLNEKLMAEPAFAQWRYQIWDFSDADEIEISVDQLRDFAVQDARAASLSPGQRIAIIPSKTSSSTLDRVFHVMEEVWGAYESKTLHSLEAAQEWGKR